MYCVIIWQFQGVYCLCCVGKMSSAVKYHSLSLAVLSHPLPTGVIDVTTSIMWNILRQLFHLISVDRLIVAGSNYLLPNRR